MAADFVGLLTYRFNEVLDGRNAHLTDGVQRALGIEAMQSINRTVINPWFLGGFMGTAVCLVLGGPCSGDGINRYRYLLAGSLLHLAGTFAVTAVFNVPMNNGLDRVRPTSEDASEAWDRYLSRWTTWNHVRTVAALLGAASLTLGFWVGPCPS